MLLIIILPFMFFKVHKCELKDDTLLIYEYEQIHWEYKLHLFWIMALTFHKMGKKFFIVCTIMEKMKGQTQSPFLYSFMNGEKHPKVTHFRWLMCCSVFPNWFVNTANIKKSGKSFFSSFRNPPLNLFCTWGHCIHSLFLF